MQAKQRPVQLHVITQTKNKNIYENGELKI